MKELVVLLEGAGARSVKTYILAGTWIFIVRQCVLRSKNRRDTIAA
jgi:hypothetical protein